MLNLLGQDELRKMEAMFEWPIKQISRTDKATIELITTTGNMPKEG